MKTLEIQELLKKFTVFYFIIGSIEVLSEYFSVTAIICAVKPMIPLLIMGMYWKISSVRSGWFFGALLFSLLTNILFTPIWTNIMMYAIVAFAIHRIFLLIYVFKLLKVKDLFPIVIGFIPFFCLFSYIFKFAGVIAPEMYVMVVVQNCLISLLGGTALSNYIMNDNAENSWLYLCGLLFVLLQVVIFMERFYILIAIFRPIAMLLNVCAFYCFFRFVISEETLNNDSAA